MEEEKKKTSDSDFLEEVRELVEKCSFHQSLVNEAKEPYLISDISILLPVGEKSYHMIKKSYVASSEPGATQSFHRLMHERLMTSFICDILSTNNDVVEEVYAEDEDSFLFPIGKTIIEVNHNRVMFPVLYVNNSDVIMLDLTNDKVVYSE